MLYCSQLDWRWFLLHVNSFSKTKWLACRSIRTEFNSPWRKCIAPSCNGKVWLAFVLTSVTESNYSGNKVVSDSTATHTNNWTMKLATAAATTSIEHKDSQCKKKNRREKTSTWMIFKHSQSIDVKRSEKHVHSLPRIRHWCLIPLPCSPFVAYSLTLSMSCCCMCGRWIHLAFDFHLIRNRIVNEKSEQNKIALLTNRWCSGDQQKSHSLLRASE